MKKKLKIKTFSEKRVFVCELEISLRYVEVPLKPKKKKKSPR